MTYFQPHTPPHFYGPEVLLDPALESGTVIVMKKIDRPDKILIGTGPLSRTTWCQREALRIVRTGLAEVLEWLGEPAYSSPPTGQQIWDRLSTRGA